MYVQSRIIPYGHANEWRLPQDIPELGTPADLQALHAVPKVTSRTSALQRHSYGKHLKQDNAVDTVLK